MRFIRLFRWMRNRGYQIDAARRRLSVVIFRLVLRRVYGTNVSFRAFEKLAAEEAERWSEQRLVPVRLSIIVVTYKQPMALQCLLASLACQVLQNFEVSIYHDGADPPTRKVADEFVGLSNRFRYFESDQRFNDWGHTLRDIGINESDSEFLLITNGDNYYVPRFTEFVFEAIDISALDVVLWDLVHSYSSPGRRTLRCYTPFRVFPVRYMVDIAGFLVRTSLAKRVGFKDKSHSGDANYIDQVLRLPGAAIRVGKVEKTLAVHN